MWVMKISIPWRETALISNLAKKHKINLIGYPVSHEVRGDGVYVVMSGIFLGETNKLKNFHSDFVKDKRILKLEFKDNHGIIYMKQHIMNKFLYQPGIFYVKPLVVNNEGTYIFELACWEKNKLMKLLRAYKRFNVKLHWIKNKKITNVQILSVFPELTDKQRKVLQIAIDNKYYDYPRKITLNQLAKIAKISYSTYQFHLRIAEKKVMPFLSMNL